MRASWGRLGSRLGVWGLSWCQSWGSGADLGSKMGGLGPILDPRWKPKCSKNPFGGDLIGFFLVIILGSDVDCDFVPIWIRFESQNRLKSIHLFLFFRLWVMIARKVKISTALERELHFQRFRGSKINQNVIQKSIKNKMRS